MEVKPINKLPWFAYCVAGGYLIYKLRVAHELPSSEPPSSRKAYPVPNETAEEKAPKHSNMRKQGCSLYGEKTRTFLILKRSITWRFFILWMEEILHQLVTIKPSTNWCRISSIHSTIEFWLKILSLLAGKEMLGPGRGTAKGKNRIPAGWKNGCIPLNGSNTFKNHMEHP